MVPVSGDFEEWYAAQHAPVLASMVLVAGCLHEAREATDEAFARAYERWERVRRMDSAGGWTYKVALNVLRRRTRRQAIERRLLVHRRPVLEVPPPAGEAWQVVAELPRRQRTAVVLRYVADLTEPEIARAMGVTRGTVSSALVAARRSLAAALGEPAFREVRDG